MSSTMHRKVITLNMVKCASGLYPAIVKRRDSLFEGVQTVELVIWNKNSKQEKSWKSGFINRNAHEVH